MADDRPDTTQGDTFEKLTSDPAVARLLAAIDDGDRHAVRRALAGLKTPATDLYIDEGLPIRMAAKTGDVEIVALLDAAGADLNSLFGEPLRNAAECGHIDIVDYLLDRGCDVNVWNGAALRNAAAAGHTAVAARLVERGADVHACDESPLRSAVLAGHANIVKLLLDNGADASHGNGEVLVRAVERNAHDIVKHLLQAGADPEARGGQAGRTAMAQGYYPIWKTLKEWPINQRRQTAAENARRAAALFGDSPSLSQLREAVSENGDTGLIVMARAQKLRGMLHALNASDGGPLTAADLLRKNAAGECALDVMADTGAHTALFDSRLWQGRTDEMARLWSALPFGKKKNIDFTAIAEQARLREMRGRLGRVPRLRGPGRP